MPREIRPWYRPHINWYGVGLLCASGVGIVVGAIITWRVQVTGLYLLLPSLLFFQLFLGGLWSNRNPWIFETHKGRKVVVLPDFRDEAKVCIDDRCVWVFAERGKDSMGLYRAVNFASMKRVDGSPMTQDERVDVLDVLLEHFESRGTRVILDEEDLPDTPYVRATLKRMGKEFPERGMA